MQSYRGVCSFCQSVQNVIDVSAGAVVAARPMSDFETYQPVFLLIQHTIPGAPRFCDGTGQEPETFVTAGRDV